MKTIFIFPILFLFFGVSEHQTAVLEDCDEDLSTSSPFSKSAKPQTQRKSEVFTTKPPPSQFKSPSFQRSQKSPVSQYKKQTIQSVRKPINGPPTSQFRLPKRRPLSPPPMRSLGRRQQRPVLWPSKPKHLLLKPLVTSKPVEPPTKRKLTDYFPGYQFKKQKRIKIIPTYEEYETYPEADYMHEFVYPEARNYDYLEMDNAANFGVPCDHDDSEYHDLSMEDHEEEQEIIAREMDVTEEFSSTEKSIDSGAFTESQIELTTPTIMLTSSANMEARDADIPISSTPDTLTNVMEMLIKGILALISCMKAKAPFLDDIISNVLNSAISSCNSFSS